MCNKNTGFKPVDKLYLIDNLSFKKKLSITISKKKNGTVSLFDSFCYNKIKLININ